MAASICRYRDVVSYRKTNTHSSVFGFVNKEGNKCFRTYFICLFDQIYICVKFISAQLIKVDITTSKYWKIMKCFGLLGVRNTDVKQLAWARGAQSRNHNKGADWLWYLKHGKFWDYFLCNNPGRR